MKNEKKGNRGAIEADLELSVGSLMGKQSVHKHPMGTASIDHRSRSNSNRCPPLPDVTEEAWSKR